MYNIIIIHQKNSIKWINHLAIHLLQHESCTRPDMSSRSRSLLRRTKSPGSGTHSDVHQLSIEILSTRYLGHMLQKNNMVMKHARNRYIHMCTAMPQTTTDTTGTRRGIIVWHHDSWVSAQYSLWNASFICFLSELHNVVKTKQARLSSNGYNRVDTEYIRTQLHVNSRPEP